MGGNDRCWWESKLEEEIDWCCVVFTIKSDKNVVTIRE